MPFFGLFYPSPKGYLLQREMNEILQSPPWLCWGKFPARGLVPWWGQEPAGSLSSPTVFPNLEPVLLLFVSFFMQPNLPLSQNWMCPLHKSSSVAAARSFPKSQEPLGLSCQKVVLVTAGNAVVVCSVLAKSRSLDWDVPVRGVPALCLGQREKQPMGESTPPGKSRSILAFSLLPDRLWRQPGYLLSVFLFPLTWAYNPDPFSWAPATTRVHNLDSAISSSVFGSGTWQHSEIYDDLSS